MTDEGVASWPRRDTFDGPASRAAGRRAPVLCLMALVVSVAFGLAGCGRDEERTALAVHSPRWTLDAARSADPSLLLETECAEVFEVTVEAGAGVEGVPLVTVWGRPTVGRCLTEVVIEVPEGTTRVEDAATGTVVDVPAFADL